MHASTRPAPTLDQALRAAGYGHRALNGIGREVYRLADGAVIGVFDAKDAWAFLRSVIK